MAHTDPSWERLLTELRTIGRVREEPGRIIVSLPRGNGDFRVVAIVMTPRQWEELAMVIQGDVEGTARWVGRTVRDLGPEERFLVFYDCDLHPGATPDIPPDPEREALDAYLREHPEARGRVTLYAYTPGTEPPGVDPRSARLGPLPGPAAPQSNE